MNTKSTGWAGYDHDGTAIVGSERNQYLDLPCVTVIGTGEHPPKVFTEEDVNAAYAAGQAASLPTLNIGMGEPLNPNDDPWAANMRLHGKTSLIGIIRSERRDYEDQITRDRALIHTLVNALDSTEALDNGCPIPTWQKKYDAMCDMRSNAFDAAKEQGFTPTEG